MKRFVKRHNDRIMAIIAGYDRVVLRGTLRSISYVEGMEIFLRSRHVLNRDFGAFSERATRQLREHARQYARRAGRPYLYQASSTASKETLVQQTIQGDGVREGLICVMACVEPCRTFKIYGNRETKTADLRPLDGKCEHVYFYFLDRDMVSRPSPHQTPGPALCRLAADAEGHRRHTPADASLSCCQCALSGRAQRGRRNCAVPSSTGPGDSTGPRSGALLSPPASCRSS